MKTNILLIYNPKAGSIDVSNLLSKFNEETKKCDFKLHIFETTGENDSQKINKRLKENKFQRVIVAGGDGTINLVAGIILETNLVLGIIPCGSANGLSTSLNMPKKLDEQIQVALTGNYIRMDCIEVNGHICLHISDLGINAELINNFDKKKIRGLFGYFLQTIPTLKNSEYPYNFNVELYNQKIKKEGILLAFANASQYGTGANINPKGSIVDGKFEVVIFKKLNFFTILQTFFSNNKLHPDYAESFCVEETKVYCTRPVALQVDGEYLGEFNEIHAQIKKQVLNIAIPS